MVTDIFILAGLSFITYLNWNTYQQVENLEAVVTQMLLDLGDQGILKVSVEEDDD